MEFMEVVREAHKLFLNYLKRYERKFGVTASAKLAPKLGTSQRNYLWWLKGQFPRPNHFKSKLIPLLEITERDAEIILKGMSVKHSNVYRNTQKGASRYGHPKSEASLKKTAKAGFSAGDGISVKEMRFRGLVKFFKNCR